jgi:hypothetical protein
MTEPRMVRNSAGQLMPQPFSAGVKVVRQQLGGHSVDRLVTHETHNLCQHETACRTTCRNRAISTFMGRHLCEKHRRMVSNPVV